jgi:probable rRNA maturation factor
MAAHLEIYQAAGRKIPVRLLGKAAAAAVKFYPSLRQREISVAIVGDRQMRQLNRTYHGVDTTTDVLTFSLDAETVEIIICYDQARRQAGEADWPVSSEIQLLLVHGLLHSLGFNDQRPADEQKMRRAEAVVMAKLR